MSELGSISELLIDLKRGDQAAAEAIWRRTVQRIAAAARKRLSALRVRGVDEEDVVIDVFASLCRGAEGGRFPRLNDTNDLWQVLFMLTRQKVIDVRRRRPPEWTESALGAQPDGEPTGLEWLVQDDLHTEFVAHAVDEFGELLAMLDEQRQHIALLRMDGCTVGEIAAKLDISQRSVERKLALIRKRWTHHKRP